MAGRTDSSVYASKADLLQWASELLQLRLSRLEQFASGALYCQLIDAYFPNIIALHKVNFVAREEYEFLQNYKQLQAAFNKLRIARAIDVPKLSRATTVDNLEFLQWHYKYLRGRHVTKDYNPAERRAVSLKGPTDHAPLPIWLGNSFDVYGRGSSAGGGAGTSGSTLDSPNSSRNGRSLSRIQSSRSAATPPASISSSFKGKKSVSKMPPTPSNTDERLTPQAPAGPLPPSRSMVKRSHTPSRTPLRSVSTISSPAAAKPSASYLRIHQQASSRTSSPSTSPRAQPPAAKDFPLKEDTPQDAPTKTAYTEPDADGHEDTSTPAPVVAMAEPIPLATATLPAASSELPAGVAAAAVAAAAEAPVVAPRLPPLAAAAAEGRTEPESPSAEAMSPGAKDSISDAVDVLGQAVSLLQRTTPNLGRLAPALGTPNDSYAFRGKIRSLQDATSTLAQHCWRLQRDLQELGGRRATAGHLRLSTAALAPLVNDLQACDSMLTGARATVAAAEAEVGPPQPNPPRLADQHRELSSTKHLDAMLRTLGSAHAAMLQRCHREAATTTARFLDLAQPSSPASSQGNGTSGTDGGEHKAFTTTKVLKLGEYQMKRLKNGDIYKGRYVSNRKNGEGVYSFINADVYEGEFKDDRMEGHGVYTFSHEGRYEGQWSHAVYEGSGAETFAKGSTYQGQYTLGLRHGWGACRFYSGDYYEGHWFRGLRDGRGMQQCTDDSNYVGDYHKGKRHGFGVYSFPNGDRYVGEYQEDIPHGHGVYLFATGQSYEGQWVRGRKHGWSIYTVETGERWAGQWVEGKPLWVQPLPPSDDQGEGAKAEDGEGKAGEGGEEGRTAEVQSNLELSWAACRSAQQAAKLAAARADDHWKVSDEIQGGIHKALQLASTAAEEAQRMRASARELAARLDAAAALVEDRKMQG